MLEGSNELVGDAERHEWRMKNIKKREEKVRTYSPQ